MKHIPIYLDKQLFGELRDRDLMPVQSQGVVRRPKSPRASRREKWRIEEFDQLELRKLRITGVPAEAAAAMLGLPEPAVRRFYEWVGEQTRNESRCTQCESPYWFGEIPVPDGRRIRCPNRRCSAIQTWYLPDPATGESLPCRACRTRELVKRTRTEKMPAQSRGGVKPEP